jgi:hypothetical protein
MNTSSIEDRKMSREDFEIHMAAMDAAGFPPLRADFDTIVNRVDADDDRVEAVARQYESAPDYREF